MQSVHTTPFPSDGASEPARRTRSIRGFALATLALTAGYLAWRITSTVDLGAWWVALPLLAAEVHNALGLGLYTFSLWDVSPLPPASNRPPEGLRVAVLIPTYNEPEEVVLPAIAAAVALEPEHETWVLDDGHRPWLRNLAEALGARYLARSTNEHAKAGNLNHALARIDADVVAVLDADYVALPGFLERTLPYFADPAVAVVQAPQDFYNLDSFEHEPLAPQGLFNEEEVFYRMIGPAKNRWGAAFWCGTCAVLRVAALRSAGGVATDAVTEDILTTVRLHQAGWRSVYHNEVLARGLAPADAEQYLTQRRRWATGAMQVLRRANPLSVRGLALPQRLAYATTLYGWFDSWRTFVYLALPVAVVTTGASPVDAPLIVFGPLLAAVFLSQATAQRLLARGYFPLRLAILFEVIRLPAVLPATLALFVPARVAFRVTPKGRQGADRHRPRAPVLLVALLGASVAAVVLCALTLAGLTPLEYGRPGVAAGAAGFAALNAAFLWAAVRRITSPRFAGERRASVRFPARLGGAVGTTPCTITDLSLTGALVEVAGGRPSPADRGALTVGDGEIVLACEVRRRLIRLDGSRELGLEFADGQEREVARLAVWLFTEAAEPEGALVRIPSARVPPRPAEAKERAASAGAAER